MTYSSLLVFVILGAASAAPWPSTTNLCSRECPVAGSPKLFYAPEKTYVYSYTGKSRINLKDVEGANTDIEWRSQVELSWLSPCDMAITMKNPSMGGGSGSSEARFLERYPLVVSIIDGRVMESCAHPDDDVWSVNMKKGIASAFQNTLPSNSSINTGLNFTETDIIGNCSTMYEVKNEGEKVVVMKMKNHRFCQDHFINRAESTKAWLKAPLPMEESFSECKQEITKGVYTSITCKDKNIIRPAYGSYKYIEAVQESTLRFESETDNVPPAVSHLPSRFIRKTLRYDQHTMKKDPSMVAKLDAMLKEVCQKMKHGVQEDTASYLAKALQYMRRVPEEAIPQTLEKIRGGQICEQRQKLESMFLDGLAFVYESGAVKVMVQELVSGKATGGRAALYAASMYFMPRPCIHSIEALKPLFEQYQRFPRTTLAGASMVHTYCRQNPKCQEKAPVRQLAETLSTKVGQVCTPSPNEQTRKQALVLLKSLGNMGVMNSEMARPIMQCIENSEADQGIRIAATQAFRNVRCTPEIHPAIKQLINVVLDPRKKTEVRIGSYLAAVKCAKYEDLKKITDKIAIAENTQVRSFILSHLQNVRESTASFKGNLKNMLETIVLPSNFTKDWRKISRNVDLSYYAPTFGVGAGMESNLIYAPGSFIPRSVNLNLTGALGATPFNIGEIGARFEGIESIIEEMFGPESYLRKTPSRQILRDLSSNIEETFNKINKRLQGSFRQRRSIDLSQISHLFDKLYGNRHMQKADFYARINNQEMAFGSLMGNMKNIKMEELINNMFDSFDDMINRAAENNLDTVRAAQLYLDYHLPTMQGLPLKMKLEGTAMVGLKMESRVKGLMSGTPGVMKFYPSLSTQIDAFIGYDCHIVRTGIKMRNRISTNVGTSINAKYTSGEGFEVALEIPEKMELLNMRSETYLMKRVMGQEETKINPSSVRSTRFQSRSCVMKLEPMLGLKLCYDVNMPNIFRSEGLPLGPPANIQVFLEKADSGMRGIRVMGREENTGGKRVIKIELETPGSSSPRKCNALISSTNEGEAKKISATFESEHLGGIKIQMTRKWTQSEKQLEMIAYSSESRQYNPSTKGIEAKFLMIGEGQEAKLDMALQTLAAVRERVQLNFEASADMCYIEGSIIPYPRRLRKFETNLAFRQWHLVSFVRKESESQYKSQLKFGQKGNEKVEMTATHVMEGSSFMDMALKTNLEAKIGSARYKKNLVLYNQESKKGVALQVVSQGESAKVIEVEMMLMRSGETHHLKLLLDIPAHMKKMMLEASAAGQGSSQYQVKAVAKHGESNILQVEGPLTAMLSSKNTQLKTEMNVVLLRCQPYTVSTSLVSMHGKQAFTFELKNKKGRLIATEWNMANQDGKETNVQFRIIVPSMVEKTIIVIVSEKVLHLSFNQVITPKSSSPLRRRGFFDIDFESKKANAEFAWDVDRNPNEKIQAEVRLINPSATLRDCVIQGNWIYLEKQHQFKAELKLSDPRTWFIGRNSLMLEVTTPSQQMYKMNAMVMVEKESSGPKVETEGTLRTPANKEYKWNSQTSLEWREGLRNCKMMTKVDLNAPEGRQSTMNLEAMHHWTPTQREADLKIDISCPSLQQPIRTQLQMNNQQGEYSTKWVIEMGSPVNGAMYKLKLSPEGGVQGFEVELNLKQVSELMKALEHLLSSTSSSMTSMATHSSALYRAHFKNHERHSLSLLLMSPSRTMEGECKCNDCTGTPCSDCHCGFIPHKGMSSAKYEIALRQSHSDWNRESRFEGRISHPSLERDLQMDIQLRRDEQKVTGTVELDIFQKPEDKIIGKLESSIIAKNTVIVEAQLSGKVLKVQPKVIVSAARGPGNYGFDIKFHKTLSSPTSFLMSGRIDVRSGRNAAISFMVKNENQKAVDIALALHPHQSSSCYGVRAEGKAMTSLIGTYDIYSELCKPAFIEMTTRKHGSDKMHVTKIGMKGLKDVEVCISEANPDTMEKRPIGMARLMLTSPSMMKLETKYEGEKLHQIKSELHEIWRNHISSAGNWMDSMSREVLKEGSSSPSAQMSVLWQEIKNEASRIYSDLENDLVIPRLDNIRKWTHSTLVTNIAEGCSKLWNQYAHFQLILASSVSDMIRTFEEQFSGLTNVVKEVVVGTARGMKTGEMPQEIQRWWSEFQESSVYRNVESEFESLWRNHQEEYQGLKQILSKIKSTLRRNVDMQRRNIMLYKKPTHIVNWIVNRMNFDQMMFKSIDMWIKNVVQHALFLPVQMEGRHFQLQLPIRRPVHSLPQALSYVSLNPVPVVDRALWWFEALMPTSVDNIVWTYYKFLPRHARYLLPPFNRTAMVVDGTEILTFDGAVLRVPHSPCKVLLAQYKTHSLMMENQKSAPSPHFIMKAAGATIEVKPDLTVTVNGSPVRGPREVQSEVEIVKDQEKIKVKTPFITLRVYRMSHAASVEVSGWTFGKVAGLLGTYDGEMGNDWMTPQGTRAPNMQELVKSWQENQQCQTPQVAPVSPMQVPVVHALHCQALFGVRSRCNPIVRPEPFRKMCFASRNACHVAKAYRAICETKGIKEVFPLGC
ncbi:vitellogenin-like [Palaemon carinicauda]|uniref:vitellogenin-like n=1 Tax=Palaemon carinicauda TaxID=392227 RepID=UPI0035B5D457